MTKAKVVSVSLSDTHTFQKPVRASIQLIAGHGVAGDAHAGVTVKHRSRVAKDPSQPNLRQIHLIHRELHKALSLKGFRIAPGDMGENITTEGIDLLGLASGTQLAIGDEAVITVTGLRNPCAQLDSLRPGLMKATLDRDSQGNLVRKAGVMGVVTHSGWVRAGDAIVIIEQPSPATPLTPV
ncbi:MAG: MOSC domain-containing protein [Pseudomonadota bacterium]